MYTSIVRLSKALLASGTIFLFSFFSCKKDHRVPLTAEAIITGTKADTLVNGRLHFVQQKNSTVRMELDIQVPKKANSSVAVHLHEHGMCGNAGADAHGHWNPTGKSHGKWASASYHAGDIGNIVLDNEGKGKLTIVTDLWTIGGDGVNNILNKGVIVHSGVDDYTSQPAGNSGHVLAVVLFNR